MATVSLASLIVRVQTTAATLDSELIVAALDVQDERGEPAGLEGMGLRQIALRFELLPPLVKGDDALACAHLLRIAGFRQGKEKGAPIGPLKPSTPAAAPTDLLWMDGDRAVHVLRVAAVALAPTKMTRRSAWFFRAAAVGIDRVIEDTSVLLRHPSALVHPDAESWRTVYG